MAHPFRDYERRAHEAKKLGSDAPTGGVLVGLGERRLDVQRSHHEDAGRVLDERSPEHPPRQRTFRLRSSLPLDELSFLADSDELYDEVRHDVGLRRIVDEERGNSGWPDSVAAPELELG